MNLYLNVDVYCTDGAGGHSTGVTLDPKRKRVSHVVVKTKGLWAEEYLAPLAAITNTDAKKIDLGCSREELAKFEPFVKTVASSTDVVDPGLEGIAHEYSGPYAPTDYAHWQSTASSDIMEEGASADEVVVRADTPVHATDGSIGKVDGFFVSAGSGEIMHLLLREGHLWGRKEIVIAVEQIDRISEEVVQLTLPKEAVEQLPHI